jgi:hypothetical protein
MIWLSWRQHRGALFGAFALLAVLGVVLMTHGVAMHHAYDRDGVEACQLLMFGGVEATAEASAEGSCSSTFDSFENSYAGLPTNVAAWLPFLPMVVGMLLGAPLLAREYEQGTWQLVWTQGVTRTRWLATKLAVVLGGVVMVTVVFAAGVSWWFEPLSPHRFSPEKFNHAVPVFTGYVLVALAIGVLAGVLLRRTLVAAAVTIPAYLAVRLITEFGLRPRYREPLSTDDPAEAAGGWIIHDVTFAPSPDGPALASGSIAYHPDDRFWQFQAIETTLLVVLAAVLLAIAWRVVLGRGPRVPAVRRDPAVPVAPARQ